MTRNGGYILADEIAPLWIGEFGGNASALAPRTGTTPPGGWWGNVQAWLAEADVDWCWWAMNPTHGQSSAPGTSQIENHWDAPEPYGLLTPDWSGVGYPEVMTMLKAIMPPRTGPGVA
jgi:hypothetical protein